MFKIGDLVEGICTGRLGIIVKVYSSNKYLDVAVVWFDPRLGFIREEEVSCLLRKLNV